MNRFYMDSKCSSVYKIQLDYNCPFKGSLLTMQIMKMSLCGALQAEASDQNEFFNFNCLKMSNEHGFESELLSLRWLRFVRKRKLVFK